MKVLSDIEQTRAECRHIGPLALVPTMGALHEGHLSLIRMARHHAKRIVVSIFVNPTQFTAKEDFAKYPRPIERDLEACEKAGVDLVFNPSADQMYPPGVPDVVVDLPILSGILEGKHRQGHFKGVCQVVSKLFNITQPAAACFGEKDYQQLRIINAMVSALNFPIQIIACPTLRDPDGLAMSSRNQLLSPEDRTRALTIFKALSQATSECNSGITQTNRLIATMQRIMLEQHLSIDYIAAIDPQTLKPIEKIEGPAILAIAARVGTTRLIDNVKVG